MFINDIAQSIISKVVESGNASQVRIDSSSSGVRIIGINRNSDATSVASWFIIRLSTVTSEVVLEVASLKFDKVWDDRVTFFAAPVAITATPTTVSVGTSEVAIAPIAGQTFIHLAPTGAGKFHVRLATGVSDDSPEFSRGDPIQIDNWEGSVFVKKESGGNINIEVTQG